MCCFGGGIGDLDITSTEMETAMDEDDEEVGDTYDGVAPEGEDEDDPSLDSEDDEDAEDGEPGEPVGAGSVPQNDEDFGPEEDEELDEDLGFATCLAPGTKLIRTCQRSSARVSSHLLVTFSQFRTRISPLSPTASASSLRTRLAELDGEMDALESRLRLLAAERRCIVQGLNSIMYPVLTLPPEITAQIFSHYVDKPHIGRTRTPGRGPLLLASVCRNWRDICLSMGSLWASLCLYPGSHSSWDIEDLLSPLRSWLSRAGSHPLDLHVFRSSSASISKIFSFLSQYSRQWRTLRLTLDNPFSFPNNEIRGRIPCLTKLVVNMITETDDEPVMMIAFSNAPCLHEAQLSGVSLQWISLPWIQLTHLDFSHESVSTCVEVLKQMPKLEVLVIFLTLSWDSDPPSALLMLPHLHTLKFLEGSPRLFPLGLRSAWSLRSIRLMGMAAERSIFCLLSIPSLEEVEICTTDWPDYDLNPLVELLTNDDGFLPALRALTLGGCIIDISTLSLVEMISSRWNGNRVGVAQLESFHLLRLDEASDSASVEQIRTQLCPLAIEGLEVVIDSPPDM
ncbi:hypothetical protein B0H10DRAFT_1958730 [Mycena sp. CBHHK59/15]|nr:hypothetical protein B0H10DRAFT_1958730 [Mycena sp. CBHHK59/15]